MGWGRWSYLGPFRRHFPNNARNALTNMIPKQRNRSVDRNLTSERSNGHLFISLLTQRVTIKGKRRVCRAVNRPG